MRIFQHTFTRFIALFAAFAAATLAVAAASTQAPQTRILIFSGMTDAQTNAFYGRMNQSNAKVDKYFRPQKLDQADIVVYLLKSWDDLAQAPGARQLPNIFEQVKAIDEKAVSHTIWADLTGGHSLRFLFFSLEAAGYPGLTCYADYVAREVDRKAGDEFSNPYLRDCKK